MAVAAALTPAKLERTVNGLRFGWGHRHDPDAAQTQLAELLRSFTTSTQPRCRVLAAQAFPLTVGTRHRWANGAISATKLATDPDVARRIETVRGRARPELIIYRLDI